MLNIYLRGVVEYVVGYIVCSFGEIFRLVFKVMRLEWNRYGSEYR